MKYKLMMLAMLGVLSSMNASAGASKDNRGQYVVSPNFSRQLAPKASRAPSFAPGDFVKRPPFDVSWYPGG